MRVNLSPHAIGAARKRMAWSAKQAVEYFIQHLDYAVFTQGEGCYNISVGGLIWVVTYDLPKNEIRVLTLFHRKPWNTTGWLGPITDDDGNRISYSTNVQATGPVRYQEYERRNDGGCNKNGIGRYSRRLVDERSQVVCEQEIAST